MAPSIDLPGDSPAVAAIRAQVARLLARQTDRRPLPPILIQGETGTGKGLLASLIHRASARAAGPFVAVNCAAIPETLLEAELFGFERGAFTDARQAKAGLFQTAHRGTIFLDEIGLLPPALQAKLLKAIEERAVRRLGSTRSEPVDASIVAATNEDLAAAARARRFREDLFHRLAVLTVTLPPLRQRGRDVILLAERFLAEACAGDGRPGRKLAADAEAALLAYGWPGNVRELGNVIERVAWLSEERVITAATLALPGGRSPAPREQASDSGHRLDGSADAAERERLWAALEETGWNVSRTAVLLDMTRNTLRHRMEKHGLVRPAGGPVTRPRVSPAPAPDRPTPGPAPRRVALMRAAADDPTSAPLRSLQIFAEKVEGFGGSVEDASPGALAAVFGLDGAESAPVHAALAAMAIARAAERAREDGYDLRIRAGVHVGQYPVGDEHGALRLDGDAARGGWQELASLLASVEGAGVFASEAAMSILRRTFDLSRLGVVAGAGAAYRVTRRRAPGQSRFPVPFVGRGQDLDLLRSRLATSLTGRGQFVGIVGEAGLGKSRLVFEFLETLRGQPITRLEGRCAPYGQTMPYLPILDVLRQAFGLLDVHDAATIASRVRAGFTEAGMDAAQWAPYLLKLLGVREETEGLAALSPEALQARTLEGMRQLILRGSRRRPIVLVLEDMHWIDGASAACVERLVEGLGGAALLLLATYRPGHRPAWVDRSDATQIALQPLSVDDSRALMRAVLGDRPVADETARRILSRAEGNPFFIEELSSAVRVGGDAQAATAVPDTIQDVLLARVDRLPERTRLTLQAASLFGRECAPAPLAGTLGTSTGVLERDLQELMRLEFLYERPGAAGTVYVFRHALTQEVAYGSVPAARRLALHTAAGRALEALHGDNLADAYEDLAHHYERSDQRAKALEYLTLLGQKATALYAYGEAARAFEDARRYLDVLPETQRDRRALDLMLAQASALLPLGRLRDIVALLLPQRETVERLADAGVSARYHFALGYTYVFLDRARSVENAERAIEEADRSGDRIVRGKAYCLLGQDAVLAGRAVEGVAHGRRALELLATSGEHWWFGRAHWVIAMNHTQTGEYAEALEALAAASALAESTGDPRLGASVAWTTGVLHAVRGEAEAAAAACRRAVDLAPDPMNRAIATGWLGYALMEAGEAGAAIERLAEPVAQFERFGYHPLQAWFAAFLAEGHRLGAQIETARRVARQSLDIATRTQVPPAVGWASLVLGRIACDTGEPAEAERHFRDALATFAATHSRYEIARTRMDLALAAHAQGRPDEARALLEAARRSFAGLELPHHVSRVDRLARDLSVAS